MSRGGRIVEDFGKVLRQFRKHRRMTQTELATAVGVAPAYVSQIESSLRVPSLRVARRIAEVLHVDLPALLSPAEDIGSRDHLSDVEKLEVLQNLVRSIEHDLESRPAPEEVETCPGAKGVRLVATSSVAVRSYTFRVASVPTFLHAHDGEETVYCASGRVRVRVDEEEHTLKPGEMLRFDPSRAHVVTGESGAVAVSTVMPPPTADTLRRIAADASAPPDAAWVPEAPRSAKAV